MKKIFFLGVLLIAILAINVTVVSKADECVISLSSLTPMAQATDTENPCPGGQCSYYESSWIYNPNTNKYEWVEKLICTACCAAGQYPHCGFTGCGC